MRQSSFSRPGRRRGFFAGLLATLCAGIPTALGLGFLLSPLRRNGRSVEQSGFIALPFGPAALPDDGTPQRVTVTAGRADAWNYHPDQPVGSVWLRRLDGGRILAWNTVCPHLGCAVEHRAAKGDFFCPCHLSAFDLQGQRQNAVPPRDMDLLETRVEGDRIWIRFQNFRRGIEEKIAVW